MRENPVKRRLASGEVVLWSRTSKKAAAGSAAASAASPTVSTAGFTRRLSVPGSPRCGMAHLCRCSAGCGEKRAVALDVIGEAGAYVLETRLPPELAACVLDREPAPVGQLHLVGLGEHIRDLDLGAGHELHHDPRDLPGRDERLAGGAVEDTVGVVRCVEERSGEAGDVGRVRVVAREGPA